jgi:hypothetical protein
MFRYLTVFAMAGAIIYVSQHPEILGLTWSGLSARPDFKVWIEETHVRPNNDRYYILDVQSREDKPLIVKGVVMNDDPKCVNLDGSFLNKGAEVKLGQVLRFPLGIPGLGACEPVKVLISTDRGDSVYNFN